MVSERGVLGRMPLFELLKERSNRDGEKTP
jgi:hypothetical protein